MDALNDLMFYSQMKMIGNASNEEDKNNDLFSKLGFGSFDFILNMKSNGKQIHHLDVTPLLSRWFAYVVILKSDQTHSQKAAIRNLLKVTKKIPQWHQKTNQNTGRKICVQR